MISGSKTCTLLLGLSLSCSVSASAPDAAPPDRARPDATAALIASLGRAAPARTAFVEARFMQVLERPLVVSGELAWLGGDQLERQVEQPRKETATIAGGEVTQQREGHRPRRFSLSRAPQLQVLADSFVALLGGDAAKLDRAFVAVAHRGDGSDAWNLTLTPRDPRVAGTVARIRIDGHDQEPHCMELQEADGDVAFDLLGPLAAKMPAAPTREALAALCRAGP